MSTAAPTTPKHDDPDLVPFFNTTHLLLPPFSTESRYQR